MLSDEERTDDVVVLCLDYTGSREAHIRLAVGTSRDGMSTLHLEPVVESTPVGAPLGGGAPARSAGRGERVCRPPDLRAGDERGAARRDPDVHHPPHPAGPHPDRRADGNPAFPSLKEYGRDAATGRGLTLFNTLASNWGVQAVDGGKIVWFELPVDFPVAPASVSDGSFRFDLAGITRAGPAREPRRRRTDVSVQLLGIPVALLQKSSEEYEALFRELRLMKERAEASPGAPLCPSVSPSWSPRSGPASTAWAPAWTTCGRRRSTTRSNIFDWTSRSAPVGGRGRRVLRHHARRGGRVRVGAAAPDPARPHRRAWRSAAGSSPS